MTPGQGDWILVIEDEPRSRKLARDIVASMGFDVRDVETAEEGLALLEDALPRVILMDIRLPGISGIDALARIHEHQRTAGIPVIAVTASTLPEYREEIMKLGFFDFVAKPYHFVELAEAIERALDGALRDS